MSYITDMTVVLLDEIDMAEKLIAYCKNDNQKEWFSSKASALIEQINDDFNHYKIATQIAEKAKTDKMAESVLNNLEKRINRLSNNGDKWG